MSNVESELLPDPPVWRGRLDRMAEALKMQPHLFDVMIAVFIGVACGLGAVGFRHLIQGLSHVFWHTHELGVAHLESMPPWRRVLVPAIGGLLVGPIVWFFAREARGHGVPEVMAAVALRNGVIRARVTVTKAVASALTIASGGSAGREGPIIQIGAAIGSLTGQALKVSANRLRTYVGCGAAGGIAATFNAPIAGALFSVEVILREFGMSRLSPIVLSSVMATVVSQHFFGDGKVFEVPQFERGAAWELALYAGLGFVCALVSLAFSRTLVWSEDFFEKRSHLPGWVQPAAGGLGLGILALMLPHVCGDGQEVINLTLLGEEFSTQLLLLLLGAKLVATCLTLGSGGSGGVFAPSLFLGAVTGALVGRAGVEWFGLPPEHVGGFALVGMGGVVAGTTHAPITALLIIFEITDNYPIILPLMMVCIISTLLTSTLHPDSIYTMKLARRGIDIFQRRSADVLEPHTVQQHLRADFARVPPAYSSRELIALFLNGDHTHFYVCDEEQRYGGAIHLEDVRHLIANQEGLEAVLMAEDLAETGTPVCYGAESLSTAMQKLQHAELPELPVLAAPDDPRMIGRLRYADVVARYNAEMLRLNTAESTVQRLAVGGTSARVRLVEGYSTSEWHPPANLWGKSIRDGRIASRYGVQVILVKKPHDDTVPPSVPSAEYVVQPGDVLLIYGSDEALDQVSRL